MILAGSKNDLEEERKVSTTEGKDLANRLGIQFYEVSAKTKDNIDILLESLVRNIAKNLPYVTVEVQKKGCILM